MRHPLSSKERKSTLPPWRKRRDPEPEFTNPIKTPEENHAETLRQIEAELKMYGRLGVNPVANTTGLRLDKTFAPLRLMTFYQFIGQERNVQRLMAAIKTAQAKDRPIPHMAFISQAGTGKTSLAACCASELNRTAVGTVGSSFRDMNDVLEMVTTVAGGIAFIDEAHDLSKADASIVSGLLPLLEDWVCHTSTGATDVQPFTCIMATTSFGMLDRALRSRMGIPYQFDPYTVADMTKIVQIHADNVDATVTPELAYEIAKRSRGNPRFCLNLLRECHNATVAADAEEITEESCLAAFNTLGLDKNGLTQDDRKLLELLANGPCSLYRCAAYLGIDKTTFE